MIKEVRYKTKTHILPSLFLLVYIMTMAGITIMMALIMMGAGVWLSMAVLLGVIIFTMGLFAGEGEIILNNEGVFKKVRTMFSLNGRRDNIQFHKWEDVASFKNGKDINRSLQEYEYLRIKFRRGGAWKITNQKNDAEFQQFKNSFLEAVHQLNIEAESHHAVSSSPTDDHHLFHPITKKKTFYETVWAKIFLWLMILLVVGLIFVFALHPDYIHTHTLFRFAFVIIPGIGYILYRIYEKNK